jgi:hypothetical protein
MELAWAHHRPHHGLIIGTQAGLEREHYVPHELEHLTLTELARAAGTNSAGPISGLQLLSVMYVLVEHISPGLDQGIDLRSVYEAARVLYQERRRGPEAQE